MEIKTITNEMRDALRKPLPSEAVTKHPTKTYLSSIKAIYVVERLNDVFGIGAWKSKVEKESTSASGMVVVKLIFEIPLYGVYHESYGGNDNGGQNSKNFDLGDAFKGATTDALTKICSFLEIGLDVFKGKHDNKTTPQSEDTRPWLDAKGYAYLIEKGTVEEINTAFKTRRMKKEYKTELTNKIK